MTPGSRSFWNFLVDILIKAHLVNKKSKRVKIHQSWDKAPNCVINRLSIFQFICFYRHQSTQNTRKGKRFNVWQHCDVWSNHFFLSRSCEENVELIGIDNDNFIHLLHTCLGEMRLYLTYFLRNVVVFIQLLTKPNHD